MEFVDFRMPIEGFAQPLLLWGVCHARGQRVALLLERLFWHLPRYGPNDATRVTSSEVRRYLNEAVPRHHDDEDIDIFPRLRRRLDAGDIEVPEVELTVQALDRLEHGHPMLGNLWEPVCAALVRADDTEPTAEHCACAEAFIGSFIAHHEVEDQLIARTASIALESRDLAEIGAAMAARRGTTWALLSRGAAGGR
jgi:hemerythrin-like domain-containing protein